VSTSVRIPTKVRKIAPIVFDLDQSFKCVFLPIHGVVGQSGRCQAARPKISMLGRNHLTSVCFATSLGLVDL